MRKGLLLWALFCVLTLSGCGTVANRLKTSAMTCRAEWSRGPKVSLSTYLHCTGGMQVEKQKNGISVTISSDSLFQPVADSVQISNMADINVLANAWKKHPQMNIKVNAYTDCVHSEVKNLVLTELEAWLVKQALVDSGIPPDRINAQGWGESWPVASNATEAGRKANRRVKITFERPKS